MENLTLDLLIRSLDAELTEEESRRLDAALAASPGLRREKEQLLRLRQELAALKPAPDVDFTERVLNRLQENTLTVSARIVRLFPQVAAASVLLLIMALIGLYLAEGSLSAEVLLGTQDLLPDDAYTLVAGE